MVILYNVLIGLGTLVFGFLLGSIPNGVLIGKAFYGKDPREYGSHNSGGTNSARVFGRAAGIAVTALDMLKAIVAFWVSWAILTFSGLQNAVELWDGGNLYCWLACLGAAIGHCWSPWLHFRGGKAVSCFMASVGGTSWLGFIVCWLAFLPFYLSKRIVSRSSLISGAIIVAFEWLVAFLVMFLPWDGSSLLMWTFGQTPTPLFGWEQASVVTVMYLILVVRHKANIERLRNGTEEPLKIKK